MVNVFAHYNGTTILIDTFKLREDAEEFIKHDYILHYADEIENGEEDDIIYSDEMFISDDEIPFTETVPLKVIYDYENLDDLPF